MVNLSYFVFNPTHPGINFFPDKPYECSLIMTDKAIALAVNVNSN